MALDAAYNQSAVATETYTQQASEIVVALSTDKGRTLEGVTVYAYLEDGHFTGKQTVTDGQGRAHFNPADFANGEYYFSARYLRGDFRSEVISLPAATSVPIVIKEASVSLTVNTPTGPAANARVYLFDNDGHYLGLYLTTDENGQVVFDLPVGLVFTFRADMYGQQYWSETFEVEAGGGTAPPVETGGGRLTCTVNTDGGQPLSEVRVYLFNGDGKYTGQYTATDEGGSVQFNVPKGVYNLRANYLGYPFWTGNTLVSQDTTTAISIAHQPVEVIVEEIFQQQITRVENARVYLFTPDEKYTGLYEETDASGVVVFDLPQKVYKTAVDYLQIRHWSTEFNEQGALVRIPAAEACVKVDGAGHPLEGVRVYAFTTEDKYCGKYAETGEDGRVCIRLPQGEYKFRANYQNHLFWSDPTALVADQVHEIGIATGGGRFTFNLLANDGTPPVRGAVLCP